MHSLTALNRWSWTNFPLRARSWPPGIVALCTQALAAALTLACLGLMEARGWTIPTAPVLLHAIWAATLSVLIGLRWWWLPINALFVPTAMLLQKFQIDAWWFLTLFLLLWMLFWTTYRTGVPLYLSSRRACAAIAGLLPVNQSFRFIDLGCGLGGVLRFLSRHRPEGLYAGIELAPLPALLAKLSMTTVKYCKIERGSFWNVDLSVYDVVYAFLSPIPMSELWTKARAEMRPGSLFISNSFAVPDQQPSQQVRLDDLRHTNLYVWRF